MSPTDKVLGAIAGMQTLVENFPMSILDKFHGKVYTSVFEFIVDVLYACGIDTNEIIDFLLEQIYGVEAKIQGGIDGLIESVKDMEIDEQSKFLKSLEYSIKGILQALFMSIFTCDALPVLPNYMFDGDTIVPNAVNGSGMRIPLSSIDIFNMLKICPTTPDGSLYYSVNGGDKFYKKKYILGTEYKPEKKQIEKDVVWNETIVETVSAYTKQLKIGMQIIYECANPYDEVEWQFAIDGGEAAPEDIDIYICYNPYESNTSLISKVTIRKGDSTSEDIFYACPKDSQKPPKATTINYIKINNIGPSAPIDNDTWAYLDYDLSLNACKSCYPGHNGNTLIDKVDVSSDGTNHWNTTRYNRLMAWKSLWKNENVWGRENNEVKENVITCARTATTTDTVTVNVPHQKMALKYVQCNKNEIPKSAKICRVNYVPQELDEADCDYIVHYEGPNPNELYKTMDMNAFIWYVMNKGMNVPQIEYNHQMWDSRVSASKIGIGRNSSAEWNEWYNSKNKETEEEFLYSSPIDNNDSSPRITQTDALFPIIQLEADSSKRDIIVHIPSQKYAAIKKRKWCIDKENGVAVRENPPLLAFNSSIYKFDWDYLMGIQILHTKMLLVGLVESLLGYSLSTISSMNVNMTTKIIEAKIEKAVKSIIEADDMEVEDCYTTFSNDEMNDMLEEMMLARYSATPYGGETNTVRTHNIDDYISTLDKINTSAVMDGNVTEIKRLITDVTANTPDEPTIAYGLSLSTDGNLLKKLLWAIAMPIIKSIFTPQVVLLILINFNLMGVTKVEDFFGADLGKILNLVLNKLLSLVKSIILFVKDLIIQLLLKLFYEKIIAKITPYMLLLYLEKITYWMMVLESALNCVPLFKFKRRKIISAIDDVDYADIVNDQTTPESSKPEC